MARTLAGKLDNNNVTVTSAGTAVQFDTADHVMRWLYLFAPTINVGTVYIGGASVSAARGIPMASGDNLEIDCQKTEVALSEFWVDADNDNDTISWIALFK